MTTDDTAQLSIAANVAPVGAAVEVRCSGAWTVRGIAPLERRLAALPYPDRASVIVDGSAISALDTSGGWLLHRTIRGLEKRGCTIEVRGLRPEYGALLDLIAARAIAPETAIPAAPGVLSTIGRHAWSSLVEGSRMLSFIGATATVLSHSLVQPRRFRWRHILHNLQPAGFEALPITGLLSFLLGIVIAYQGAEQLERFGANIYIADLVGLSMVRELSPLMTAIIVAGRSGSA
jgi:phospholipid/cholesterol/gamma-HCH transport system permease protein